MLHSPASLATAGQPPDTPVHTPAHAGRSTLHTSTGEWEYRPVHAGSVVDTDKCK